MKEYYAHLTEDGRRQTVEEHLQGTAVLAKEFAEVFHAGDFGNLVGIAHDIGKYTEGFQKRLEGGPIVDHSSAGALECAKTDQMLAGMCVAGHHSGLPDFGNQTDMAGDDTFIGRMKKAMAPGGILKLEWNGSLPEVPDTPFFEREPFARSLWVRMLYSCLVDADFLDTESFMKNQKVDRGGGDSIDILLQKLQKYTAKWDNADTDLNRIRNQIRHDCIAAGNEEKGLFSLTVPTGGGKTVSSLAFALEHAKKQGLRRVIYVIPYTSIIEQNAAVFREILGEENVVEHHSEALYSYEENLTELQKRAALAAENWDAPVIVTTAVQFFDSFFSNKPSKCRKLHNVANSVVIFDEAQSIPVAHLRPCMAVIGTLVKHFGVSAVLCSATQPFVDDLLKEFAPGFPVREICRDVEEVFEKLKRVRFRSGLKTDLYDLADALNEERGVLCVVNTRQTAKEVFDLLFPDGRYHLSTLMTPRDRKRVLSEIKKRLSSGKICRVVSTSLIEAGVDVDFPSVFREMTGLDSVIQAAGRCNREGKRRLDESIVTVFSLDRLPPRILRINIGAAKEALRETEDLGKREAVSRYFNSYRSLLGTESIDRSEAVKKLSEGISGRMLPFRQVAEQFRLIDQETKTIYIPTEENRDLLELLRSGSADRKTYRKAGRDTVSIYENHYRSLLMAGDIEEIAPGAAILVNMAQYDPETGLSLAADLGKAETI